MKIEDLWIGDRVRMIKSGKVGTYEGVKSTGKLRVKVNGKIILTKANNVELLPDEYKDTRELDLIHEEDVEVQNFSDDIKNSIDLHLEELDPENRIAPVRALDYQLDKCKNYIDNAIEKRKPRITIIHGRGSGILKSEIRLLLRNYIEVYFTFDIHQGGATEVWLRYL